jgi:hypothetical protein
VSRVGQAVSQALQDGTLRKRMNDAGSNPDTSAKRRSSRASAATSPVTKRF